MNTDQNPPADQTALRDRISETLLDHLSRTADIRPSQNGELAFMPEVTEAEQARMVDAVLAVLSPPVSRADVRREAADELDAGMERFFTEWPDEPRNSPYALGKKDAAAELRRMADDAQPAERPAALTAFLARLEQDRADQLEAARTAPEEELRIVASSLASGYLHAAAHAVRAFEGPEAAETYLRETATGEQQTAAARQDGAQQ